MKAQKLLCVIMNDPVKMRSGLMIVALYQGLGYVNFSITNITSIASSRLLVYLICKLNILFAFKVVK